MSTIWSQPNCGFFSEEEKQESTQIEGLAPEGEKTSNQAPEGAISTMLVIIWSDVINEPRDKVDGPLYGVLYKEDHGSILTWSGTDPDAKLNCLTCYKEENDWIVPGDK